MATRSCVWAQPKCKCVRCGAFVAGDSSWWTFRGLQVCSIGCASELVAVHDIRESTMKRHMAAAKDPLASQDGDQPPIAEPEPGNASVVQQVDSGDVAKRPPSPGTKINQGDQNQNSDRIREGHGVPRRCCFQNKHRECRRGNATADPFLGGDFGASAADTDGDLIWEQYIFGSSGAGKNLDRASEGKFGIGAKRTRKLYRCRGFLILFYLFPKFVF